MLTRHRCQLSLDNADVTDAQAKVAVARITGGKFRLLHRLLVQIGRLLRINSLSAITDGVVHAARAALIVGAIQQCQSQRPRRAGG